MKQRERNRPTRVSLSGCAACAVTAEPLPGGRDCPGCGARMVTALVILPRADATVEHAAHLLVETLRKMAASAPSR